MYHAGEAISQEVMKERISNFGWTLFAVAAALVVGAFIGIALRCTDGSCIELFPAPSLMDHPDEEVMKSMVTDLLTLDVPVRPLSAAQYENIFIAYFQTFDRRILQFVWVYNGREWIRVVGMRCVYGCPDQGV